jgi:hypothetical protein
MPKGMKSAPPQQASLNELWGKKKPAPASTPKPELAVSALKTEDDIKMKVEPDADIKPLGVYLR